MFLHVTAVEYVSDYKLRVQFNNGAEGIVDLEPELYGEIFEPLRDKTFFKEVSLTSRTLEWPNGADFAPEFLFEIAQFTTAPTQKLGTDTAYPLWMPYNAFEAADTLLNVLAEEHSVYGH